MMIKGMETDNGHIDPVGLLPKVFAGEATAEENSLVNNWLSANEANRKEFEAFARLWSITGTTSLSEDIDLDTEWQKMESVLSPDRTIRFAPMNVLKIAASIILVSALGLLGLRINSFRAERAPLAELYTVKLPDGTVVSLNAGSKIIYKKGFGKTHRSLQLKGEAYFEVVKKDKPFIINAGEAHIRVTGTKFNVKAYNRKSEIKVTVTEGSVKLYETNQPLKEAVLLAGETGIYDKSVRTIRKKVTEDMNDLAWKTRIMDFRNTPLSEVADILGSTYHIPIDVDPAIKDCSLTVHFENQELESVFKVLQSTLDLTITRKGNRAIITGKGC